jgi:hypothetical protein
MAGLLDDALGWMQSPERTQQLQQVGGAISGGLLNIQSSKKRFDELQAQAFGDPKNPLKVTDPDALNQLTEMTMSGPMAFAPVGMTKAITQNITAKGFDPRYDPRALEQERLQNLSTTVIPRGNIQAPETSIVDLLGRPFITSMADRTAAGVDLTKINDVDLKRLVSLLGGQDYMFENPGQVWASAAGPVGQVMKQAQEIKSLTGQNPLYIPWRMAPSGGDFAHMTGETMLNYAQSNLGRTDKKNLNSMFKDYIPDWKGIDSPISYEQLRQAPTSVRKILLTQMDKNFRNEGGLSLGEARLAVSDPRQLMAQESGIQNIGEIFADKPMIMQSGHASYPKAIPGQGLGTIKEKHSIFELLPNLVKERGIQNPAAPSQTDIRALQMKPYSGTITEKLLRSLGY